MLSSSVAGRRVTTPGAAPVSGTDSPLRDPARFHVATDARGSCVVLPDQMKVVAVNADQARLLGAVRSDADDRLLEQASELLRSLGADPTPAPLAPARPTLKEWPNTLVLMLTGRCDLRCVYCYERNRPSPGPADMAAATAVAAVDWLFDHGDRSSLLGFAFFGGEPLLNRPALTAAVDRAERRAAREDRRIRFGITTNGLGLDEQTVEYLAGHDFRVTVSVDGAACRHDAQRPTAGGGGSYEAVSEGCRRLLAVLPGAGARATLLPGADPRRVRREIEALGFRRVILSPATPTWAESGSPAETCDGECAAEIRLSELEDEARALEDAIDRRDEETLRGYRGMSRILRLLESFLHGRRSLTHCGAGSSLLAVDTRGGLFPCQRFLGWADWRQGDITEPMERQPGHAPRLWALREQCLDCPARFTCAGGCPHEVSAHGGHLDDDRCVTEVRSMELAALLSGRLDAPAEAYLIDRGVIGKRPCPLDLF